MPLPERKNKQILDILDNILSYHTAAFFDHPIDPVRDQLPTYFNIVKRPMDLGTIRNKIECNEYNDVASFIADVELVWANAILFNGRNSFMYSIVRYLQTKFKEQTEFLSNDIRKDWINQMNDLRNKVNNIISNPPYFISKEIGSTALKSHHSTSSLISSASVSSIPTTSYAETSILPSYSTTNLSSNTKSRSSSSKSRAISTPRNRRKFSSNFSDDDDDDAENSNQHNERKTEHIYYGLDADDGYDNDDDDDEAVVSSRWNKKSSRSSNKKSSKSKQNKPPSSQKKSNPSSSQTKKPSTVSTPNNPTSNEDRDLTENEIEKLANDVNQLAADDDKNSEIADLLQSMEPQLSFDEEVGVEKLHMPTLKALKKLVDRLMKM